VLIVRDDPDVVEAELLAGRLTCPHCGAELRPWGHARQRTARSLTGAVRHRPRRSRCRACRSTSVLLAGRFLARRVDASEVVGEALAAKAAGAGQRTVATLVGRPRETVRNWLRRFGARATELRAHFVSWALALDARLHELGAQGSAFADAVEAVAVAARAASLRLGPRPVWSWASAMTRGGLLANTTWPFPAPS
jgi:transposase-like protein